MDRFSALDRDLPGLGGAPHFPGLPGLGKTELVKSLSALLGLKFRRVQFTPDLLPSDITGAPILQDAEGGDRKSTRLNSSHYSISYAVFCLKKKKRLS